MRYKKELLQTDHWIRPDRVHTERVQNSVPTSVHHHQPQTPQWLVSFIWDHNVHIRSKLEDVMTFPSLLGDDSLIRSRAIIPAVRGEFLRNLTFWDHSPQNFGNKTVEQNFYICLSPQHDNFKLHKSVMQREWFNTFQNKLLRIFNSLVFSEFHLIPNLRFPLRFYL